MSLAGIGKVPRECKVSPTRGAALTILTADKEGHSSQPCLREARHKDEQFSASPHCEQTTVQNETWLVKAKANITIAPRCRQIVTGRVESGKEQKLPPLIYIEPVQIPIEGILPARALSRVEQPEYVMTSEDGRKPTGRLLVIADGISESLVDKINARSEVSLIEPAKPPRKRKNENLYNKLLHGKLDHLTSAEKEHIEPVLIKYAHVFHDEESNDFKETTVIEHYLPVGEAQPIRRPQYRTQYALRDEMEQQVQKMLQKGVIRPSSSPWSAPAILVPKNHRTESQNLDFV